MFMDTGYSNKDWYNFHLGLFKVAKSCHLFVVMYNLVNKVDLSLIGFDVKEPPNVPNSLLPSSFVDLIGTWKKFC